MTFAHTAMTSTVPNLTPSGLLNYDANDRQTTEANETYDANGNTASSAAVANIVACPERSRGNFENKLVQRGTIAIMYDGDGNRVRKTAGGVTTKYLVDPNNLTGYAQVLDETQSGTVVRKYTYGLDLIAQTQSAGTSFYGYDGHGSVRQLTNTSGAVTDTYTYDAFGNLLERTGNTPNLYLYAGEQFDPDFGLYYNRARYLEVRQGRFWGMDPSLAVNEATYLHAYLYTDANPLNATDPTGLYTQAFGYAVEDEVEDAYEGTFGGSSLVSFGKWARVGNFSRRAPYALKPDILDKREIRGDGSRGMVWMEIKPLSLWGLTRAAAAWSLYDSALAPFGYSPDTEWLKSGKIFMVEKQQTLVFNVGGILFYTTNEQDYDRFQDAIAVFANTVGAIGIGAAAGALANKFLPQVPQTVSAGSEVIDISTKAAFATRASSAQSKVDTAGSEILAVASGF